ncbi:MAG: hypothetical protein V8R26_03665 [Clostridia bacterium]
MEEKSLINKENKSLFEKIRNFFRSLFHKNEDTNVKEHIDIKQETSTSIIDEFKDKQTIVKLQQDYENGKIAEEDMDENDKQKLLELYKEQIKTLNDNINAYKNSLQGYKEKIVAIRKTEN